MLNERFDGSTIDELDAAEPAVEASMEMEEEMEEEITEERKDLMDETNEW